MSPVDGFIVANQFWLVGLLFSTGSYLFTTHDADVELESSLVATTFMYNLTWMALWFREERIFEFLISVCATLASFVFIVRILSHSYGLYINIAFVIFSMVIMFAVLMAYIHLSEGDFYFLGQLTTAALLLAPTIAYRHISVPPLQFFVCALGFAAFWVVIVILQIEERVWPLIVAILTFIGTVRQFMTYQGSVMFRRRSNRPDQTFVLRELRLSLDRGSSNGSNRNSFAGAPITTTNAIIENGGTVSSPSHMFAAPFAQSPYTITNDENDENDEEGQNSQFRDYFAQYQGRNGELDETTRIIPATFNSYV